jgi:hypothetical protein
LCLNGVILLGVEASESTRNIIIGKSSLAHAVCFSRVGMEVFLQQYPQPIGDFNVDLAYNQCFHQAYVHTKYNTIVQLMETLATDNHWGELKDVANVDQQVHNYIQLVYTPYYMNLLSFINLFFYHALPYHCRPWFLCKSILAIPRHDILIYRQQQKKSFPWRDYMVTSILIYILGGITLLYLFGTNQIPSNIGMIRLICGFFTMKQYDEDENTTTNNTTGSTNNIVQKEKP